MVFTAFSDCCLNCSIKSPISFAAVAVLSVSAAQAKEHVVLIVYGKYFPTVVHVNEGDLLTFRNESKSEQVVNGADEEDADAVSWTSGPIAVEATFTHEITATTPEKFSSAFSGDVNASGELVFGGDDEDDS